MPLGGRHRPLPPCQKIRNPVLGGWNHHGRCCVRLNCFGLRGQAVCQTGNASYFKPDCPEVATLPAIKRLVGADHFGSSADESTVGRAILLASTDTYIRLPTLFFGRSGRAH